MDSNRLLEDSSVEAFLASESLDDALDGNTIIEILENKDIAVRRFWFLGIAERSDEGSIQKRILPLFAKALILHPKVTELDLDHVLLALSFDTYDGVEFLCNMGGVNDDNAMLEGARRLVERFVNGANRQQLVNFVQKLGEYCENGSYDEEAQWATEAFHVLVNGSDKCPVADHQTLAIVVDHAWMCGSASSEACEDALQRLCAERAASEFLVMAVAARAVFFDNEDSEGAFDEGTIAECWSCLKVRYLSASGDNGLSAEVIIKIYLARKDDSIGADAARIYLENFGGNIDDALNS